MEIILNGENVLLGRSVLAWKRSTWEKGLFRGRVFMEERSSWVKDPCEERALNKGKRSS